MHLRVKAIRGLIEDLEKKSKFYSHLYDSVDKHELLPLGVTVVVSVDARCEGVDDLLNSLAIQSLDKSKFEVIFVVDEFASEEVSLKINSFIQVNKINGLVLHKQNPNVASAYNAAISEIKYRYCMFVDTGHFFSRECIGECLNLCDYRSVVLSNEVEVEDNKLELEVIQSEVNQYFLGLNVFSADDVSLYYRAVYATNSVKVIPTYMAQKVLYNETLNCFEQLMFWRDVFNTFLPILVKVPGWNSVSYRREKSSLLNAKSKDMSARAASCKFMLNTIFESAYEVGTPQSIFDLELKKFLMEKT